MEATLMLSFFYVFEQACEVPGMKKVLESIAMFSRRIKLSIATICVWLLNPSWILEV